MHTAYVTTSAAQSARILIDEKVQAPSETVALHGSGVTLMAAAPSQALGQFTMVAQNSQPVEMRVIGTWLYEQLPPSVATAQLSGGKPWLKVDVSKIAHLADSTSNQAPDVMHQLSYLNNIHVAAQVGTENIDGVPCIHYKATMTAPPIGNPAARVSSPIPVEVWVDSQHRVRREKVTLSVKGSGGSTSAGLDQPQTDQVSVTMNLTDFGIPVNVAAPPSSETTDITGQLPQAQQLQGTGPQ